MFRLLLITAVAGVLKAICSAYDSAMVFRSMDFEVFGRVQGVFFRKYTKLEADKLGIRGWCKNTPHGSVQGHMQGPVEQVEIMVDWLKNTGSPSSRIDKVDFSNQNDIDEFTFEDFSIVKD